MRNGLGLALALAASVAGCRAFGWQESSDRDYSDKVTPPGTTIGMSGEKVTVVKFENDFKSDPPRVLVTLKNEGDPLELFSADVEFGYAVAPDSFAPYDPDFSPLDVADFKAGETQTVAVNAPPGRTVKPAFARVVVTEGGHVRMTAGRESSSRGLRRGSTLLRGKVEVVKVEGDLSPPAGTKPKLSFTLEHVDGENPNEEIKGMRYMVQFYDKDGKLLDLGRRFYGLKPVGKTLPAKESQCVLEVSGLEAVPGLAGSKPVLRLTQ